MIDFNKIILILLFIVILINIYLIIKLNLEKNRYESELRFERNINKIHKIMRSYNEN